MPDTRTYTADEIANMRNIIWQLYLTEELDRNMTNYQRKSLVEKMLRTYMSQSVTYDQLSTIYFAKIEEEKDKKDHGANSI